MIHTELNKLIDQQTKLFTDDSYDKYIVASPVNMDILFRLIVEYKLKVETRRYSYMIKQRVFFDDYIVTYTMTKGGRSWLEVDVYSQSKIICK